MQILMDLVNNHVLLSAFAGWLIAQVLKIIMETVKNGFSAKRLAGGGGMPSTHSATVTGLAVGAALTNGWNSTEFAIAFFLAMIVMYDAMGVRYETGLEARILNRMRQKDLEEGRAPYFDKSLDEKMGHTVPEIITGFLIGIAAACLVCLIIF